MGEAGRARGQITQSRASETSDHDGGHSGCSWRTHGAFIECGIREDESTYHVGDLVMDFTGRLATGGGTAAKEGVAT